MDAEINSQTFNESSEIRLNLDGDNEPEEILFYNPRTQFTGSEILSPSSEKGRRALALLILFTAKERKRRLKRTSKISLPSSAQEFTSTLAEEITNPNRTKGMHWLEKLFGVKPKGVFLDAARRTKDIAYFLDDILVTVSDYQDRECSEDDLQESFDRYSNDERKRTRKIEISIEVEKTVDRGGYVFSADDRSGSVTMGDQIRIGITVNYSTSLAVFWVSSDGTAVELFPKPELEIETPRMQMLRQGYLIVIPEGLFLDLDTGPGTETCIVIAGTRKFDSNECRQIKSEIKNTIRRWLSENTINRPKERVIKRPHTVKQTAKKEHLLAIKETRLSKPKNLEKWENDLMERMPDKVTSMKFFHIPNI